MLTHNAFFCLKFSLRLRRTNYTVKDCFIEEIFLVDWSNIRTAHFFFALELLGPLNTYYNLFTHKTSVCNAVLSFVFLGTCLLLFATQDKPNFAISMPKLKANHEKLFSECQRQCMLSIKAGKVF